MATILGSLKQYFIEILNKEKIISSLIFIFVLLVINIFDTNIENYDCTINDIYYSSSYLCVANDYGNIINTSITMFDPKDTTELDEVIMILFIYIIGEIIISLNNKISLLTTDTNNKREFDTTILSMILAYICTFYFIQNFFIHYIFLGLIFLYIVSFFKFKKFFIKKFNKEIFVSEKKEE